MSGPHTFRNVASALTLLVLAVATAQAGLRFDSERIQLAIRGDTLRVEGTYRLEATGPHEPVLLFFPYPVDSLLGEAWTESLAWRPASASAWRPLPVQEESDLDGIFWILPLEGNTRVEAFTVYCQLLCERYARYIVRTTAAWGRPLREARFEIRLPAGARLTECSFPFAREGELWVFTARNFMPDVDVSFRWELGPP